MSLDPTATFAGADQPEPGPDAALLRAALAGSRTSIVFADVELRCVWAVNLPAPLRAAEMAGVAIAELFGVTGQPLSQRASAVLAGGGPLRDELQLPLDAVPWPFDLLAQPAYDAAGALSGVLLTLTMLPAASPASEELLRRNVELEQRVAETIVALEESVREREREAGERRRAEADVRGAAERLARLAEDLQRSRDLLRTIFDGLDDGLLLLSHGGSILAANQRFAAMCNSHPGGLVGYDWRERCAALMPAFPVELVEQSQADGVARRTQVRSSDAQGRTRVLDLQTLHPAESSAAPDQLVVQVRDVTEQLRLQAQTVAAERMAANERLAAAVAHEVNTPLQAIENSLHLASRLMDDEQRARYLRLAREEIQRVGFMLRQLLEQYRPPSAAGPLDMNELVERVLLLTGSSLRRQGVLVVRDLAVGLPTFVGRADELTQVLLNLIFNAMQAMPRGGRLTLRTAFEQEHEAERLLVTVRDNGLGVDPAIVGRIFEPFYTTRPEGSGLGLAICQQLVEGHGGQVWLENAPGEGAAFHVALPLGGASAGSSSP